MTSCPISRRTLLKGLGAVGIGLPFLEEMLAPPARAAATPAVPVRAFNLFFGLGIPAPLQTEGFDGVLEPLRPLRDKLLILRSVDQVRCDESGINAHFDGASRAFTATPPNGEANGKTLLEYTLITISTESGDGRHNDSKRELSGVFHAVTGAAGRFKTGRILDVQAEGIDVYNTILRGMDVPGRLGPANRGTNRWMSFGVKLQGFADISGVRDTPCATRTNSI